MLGEHTQKPGDMPPDAEATAEQAESALGRSMATELNADISDAVDADTNFIVFTRESAADQGFWNSLSAAAAMSRRPLFAGTAACEAGEHIEVVRELDVCAKRHEKHELAHNVEAEELKRALGLVARGALAPRAARGVRLVLRP